MKLLDNWKFLIGFIALFFSAVTSQHMLEESAKIIHKNDQKQMKGPSLDDKIPFEQFVNIINSDKISVSDINGFVNSTNVPTNISNDNRTLNNKITNVVRQNDNLNEFTKNDLFLNEQTNTDVEEPDNVVRLNETVQMNPNIFESNTEIFQVIPETSTVNELDSDITDLKELIPEIVTDHYFDEFIISESSNIIPNDVPDNVIPQFNNQRNNVENSVTYIDDFSTTEPPEINDYIFHFVELETITSTVTVYKDTSLQNLQTNNRVKRTISFPEYNENRAFRNEQPTPVLSTFMSVQTNAPQSQGKKSERSDNEPNIDDIIHGLIKILGGNVKLGGAGVSNTRLITYGGAVFSSRINNRGPPRLPHLPFGALPPSPQYTGLPLIPLRAPVSHPSRKPALVPPGRPPYVANTLPPYLVPLPPSLASRPVMGNPRPFLTRHPLPIGSIGLTDEEENYFPVSASEVSDDEINIYSSIYNNNEEPNLHSSFMNEVIISENINDNIVEPSYINNDLRISEIKETDFPVRLTNNLATKSVLSDVFPSSIVFPTSIYDIANSLVAPGLPLSSVVLEGSIMDTLVPPPTVLQHSTASTTTTEHSKIEQTVVVQIQTTTISSIQQPPPTPPVTTTENDLESTSPISTPPLPTTVSNSFSIPPILPELLPHPVRTPQKSRPHSYKPRPGVVVDDSIFRPKPRPGDVITGAVIPFGNKPGDIFDVTVSAYQGFGGPHGSGRPTSHPRPHPYGGQHNQGKPHVIPVDVLTDELLKSPSKNSDSNIEEGYVSIDGRKTYFNLFPTETQVHPSYNTILPRPSPIPRPPVQGDYNAPGTGVGVVIPEEELIPESPPEDQSRPVPPPLLPLSPPPRTRPNPRPPPPSIQPQRRPSPPPRVRIDTCIVGDPSTCHEHLGEICKTMDDVSSCFCSPGTHRRRHRTPCKKTISLHMSMKVDRVGDQRIVWGGNYGNPKSQEYRTLQWEAKQAIDDAIGKTPLSNFYLGNQVQKFYSLGGKVIVNTTVILEDSPITRSKNVKTQLQRHMIQVIQSHSNNIGNSALWVDGPLNPIPQVADINECNDPSLNNCDEHASCINLFGSFSCVCLSGYTDRNDDDPAKVGRECHTCSSDYCNKRGECYIDSGQKLCRCKGSYYGAQCEIDGEVLGVAVGASVAAVVIIVLTLIFLCLWSRKWKAQDRKSAIMVRGMMPQTNAGYSMAMPHKPTLPYGAMDDRIRWASMAEAMANQNIYTLPNNGAAIMSDGGAYYTNNSSEYLTSTGVNHPGIMDPMLPYSMYNRVSRAFSNSIGKHKGVGFFQKIRTFFGASNVSRSNSSTKASSRCVPPPPHTNLGIRQMMIYQARLNSQQPEQLRSHLPHDLMSQQSNYHTMASREYASLGSIQQYPVNHFNLSQFNSSQTPSIYGGVSQAPTLGARTPQPLRDVRGAATMGPFGGASVVASGYSHAMGTAESSEDDHDRPYQLPRPKSRTSLGDMDDIYYEPADFDVPPRPTRGPPPLPKSYVPQTFNMASFNR